MNLPVSIRFRHRLVRPLNLWVNPLGSDTNDGLSPTTAFGTVAYAVARAVEYDLASQPLAINLAPGTYVGDVVLPPFTGAFPLTIQGSGLSIPPDAAIQGVITCTAQDAGWVMKYITVEGRVLVDGGRLEMNQCGIRFNTAGSIESILASFNHGVLKVSDRLDILYTQGLPKSWLTVYASGVADIRNTTFVMVPSAFTWVKAGVWIREGGTVRATGTTTTGDLTSGSEVLSDITGGTCIIGPSDNLPGSGRSALGCCSFVGTDEGSGTSIVSGKLLFRGFAGSSGSAPTTKTWGVLQFKGFAGSGEGSDVTSTNELTILNAVLVSPTTYTFSVVDVTPSSTDTKSFQVGNYNKGAVSVKTITLTQPISGKFTMSVTASGGGAVSFPLTLAANDYVNVAVSYTADATSVVDTATIIIASDTIVPTIGVQVTGKPSYSLGEISITPNVITQIAPYNAGGYLFATVIENSSTAIANVISIVAGGSPLLSGPTLKDISGAAVTLPKVLRPGEIINATISVGMSSIAGQSRTAIVIAVTSGGQVVSSELTVTAS